jgi:hypothetical protein
MFTFGRAVENVSGNEGGITTMYSAVKILVQRSFMFQLYTLKLVTVRPKHCSLFIEFHE